jgi:hypothetical protein
MCLRAMHGLGMVCTVAFHNNYNSLTLNSATKLLNNLKMSFT